MQLLPPTYAEIAHAVTHEADGLEALNVQRSVVPLNKNGNQFIAYLVKTRHIESIRLAYTKVCLSEPDAASIMMAYKLNNQQGSCDDGEYNTGYKLLKLIQAKKQRNMAVFVARKSSGQHLGQARFKYITDVASALMDRNADPLPEMEESHSNPGTLPSTPTSSNRSRRRNKLKT